MGGTGNIEGSDGDGMTRLTFWNNDSGYGVEDTGNGWNEYGQTVCQGGHSGEGCHSK